MTGVPPLYLLVHFEIGADAVIERGPHRILAEGLSFPIPYTPRIRFIEFVIYNARSGVDTQGGMVYTPTHEMAGSSIGGTVITSLGNRYNQKSMVA